MTNVSRTLGALVLSAALTPLASAQGIDCSRVPLSAGEVPAAYAACAQPMPLVPTEDPSDPGFGWNAVASAIQTWVHNAPGTLTTIAPYTPPFFLGAGDFMGDDLSTWYGIDENANAISVNTTTGAVTFLGTIAGLWTALTWDYVDNTFYGTTSDCASFTTLSRVNFTTLSSTLVGANFTIPCAVGLASHPTTGVLYLQDTATDALYTMSKTNASASPIGSLGFNANFGQAMDFDNEDNTLYLYAFNLTTFVAELRTANLTTGATSLVGPLGTGLQQIGAGSSATALQASGCDVEIASATMTPTSISAGGTFTINVTVRNNGNQARPATLALDYARPGGPQGTRTLGNGTLPAGAQVSKTIPLRVPGNAPTGTYTFTLRLASGATPDCDTETFVRTVTASPRLPGVAEDAVAPIEVEEVVGFFTAEAAVVSSAVSPNPFARQATIQYEVPATADVRLAVYDVLGRQVAVLADGRVEAGTHAATFDASGLAAGTYVYRLVVGKEVQTGRMTLTR